MRENDVTPTYQDDNILLLLLCPDGREISLDGLAQSSVSGLSGTFNNAKQGVTDVHDKLAVIDTVAEVGQQPDDVEERVKALICDDRIVQTNSNSLQVGMSVISNI